MKKKYILSFISVLLIVSGCAAKSTVEQEKMFILASVLTKLSSSVEAAIRYENPDKNLSDDELLEFSTKDDSSLRMAFSDYKVKILNENRHAIVLVCTQDETKALLEDIACTGEMDSHHWEFEESRPCSFTLSTVTCNR
jgi:outer membrane lipoprotein-sorting protein